MNVLVINCGSSSVKYKVVELPGRATLTAGKVERIAALEGGHAAALQRVLNDVAGLEIGAVGHRVVHGGISTPDNPMQVLLVEDESKIESSAGCCNCVCL